MKQFELNISKGTYISTDGVVGANTGFSYFRGDKGLALKGTTANTVIFSQTLTGVKTILFGIKKGADSKIFLDDAADKVEIAAGDISGTGLTQCYIDNVDTDTVGNNYKLVIAEFSAGIDFATNIKIAPSSLIHLAHKIVFYDEILTTNQRAIELDSFIHQSPKIIEKTPRFMPEYKSTDLSKEIGIAASFNFINTGGLYVDTSGEGFNITINKGISTLAGSKLSAAETIGNIGNIKSIAFRIKPDSTTEKLMEGATNDKLIHINAGTLTYPEFDLSYIDGVAGITMVSNKWQNVVITSSTNVDFSACSLALNNTTVGNFEIEDLRFFTDEKSASWAAQYHSEYASRIVLNSFPDRYDAVNNEPNGVRIVSGTFTTQELTSQDAVLKELDIGTKYISCDGVGVISVFNINMPGEIEFYVSKADASDFLLNFIMSKSDGQGNGYAVNIDANEAITGNEILGGALTEKFSTVNSYVSHSTWYKIMITVGSNGEVATFAKGGSLGNRYVLVDDNTGVNPFTDLTYVTSNYIVTSCGTGDKIIIE